MLINAYLPDRSLFQPTDRAEIFKDLQSDLFQVSYSHPPDLWGVSPWLIHIAEGKGKSNTAVYLQRVKLKALRPVDRATHTIYREAIKGKLVSFYRAEFAYGVPIGKHIWLTYSIEPIPIPGAKND